MRPPEPIETDGREFKAVHDDIRSLQLAGVKDEDIKLHAGAIILTLPEGQGVTRLRAGDKIMGVRVI